MQNKKNADNVLAIVCVGFLVLMLCTIGIRFLTRQIVIEKLGITNRFTDIVFCGNEEMSERHEDVPDDTEEDALIINWAESYPFEEGTIGNDKPAEPKRSVFSEYSQKAKEKIEKLKTPIEAYATENLLGYDLLTAFSKSYASFIGWNFTSFSEYNNIMKLGDNYFYGVVPEKDISESANSTIELFRDCRAEDIAFLYVQVPSKISKYEDTEISGITDFSNQNADAFLQKLTAAEVPTLDLREEIRKDDLIHHSLFFETDHHWKGETGLWAAGKILGKMNELGFDTDPLRLSPDRFDYVVYEDWFLGSQGKKATLEQATPEDISLIYPKESSRFHYVIPNMEIDEVGDFSVTYMMDCIEEKDYMKTNPYGAYNHADRPLIQIENELTENDCKVLIIHDSFSNCVIPFLALENKSIDALDLRTFDGSVKAYMEESRPDLVIVAYPCYTPGPVDESTHTAEFDFR